MLIRHDNCSPQIPTNTAKSLFCNSIRFQPFRNLIRQIAAAGIADRQCLAHLGIRNQLCDRCQALSEPPAAMEAEGNDLK